MSNINELFIRLQDSSPDVRSGAVEALAESGDSDAVAPLIAALEDESELVRGVRFKG